MNRIKLFSTVLLALSLSGLVSCSSTGDSSGAYQGGYTSPYASSPFASWYDSPMGKQIRMQEAQSKAMRSLIPF